MSEPPRLLDRGAPGHANGKTIVIYPYVLPQTGGRGVRPRIDTLFAGGRK